MTLVRCQASLVAPPSLKPGAGLLDEASVVLDVFESEGVTVEGQNVEQEEPTPVDDLPWCDVGRQRLVFVSARHVNERVKLGVHTLHRGHDSPDVVHVGVERRGELELDRTLHGTSMTLSPTRITGRGSWFDSGDTSPMSLDPSR